MSDFDKEAEREKLRKKYEQDQADREATKRMSDLLLKGARMTNTHCGTCGDPLFEQNGVTFCPTCHGGPEGVEASIDEETAVEEGAAAGEGAAEAGDTTDAEAAPDADGASASVDEAGAAASVDEAGTADADRARETAARSIEEDPAEADESRARVDPSESRERGPPAETSATNGSGAGSAHPTPARDARAHGSSASVGGDLEDARDALVEALERFARRAAETDDPRYAKECLQAAREASEALAALR